MTKVAAYDRELASLIQLPNGNLASAGLDGTGETTEVKIKVWNLFDLSLIQTINTGLKSHIHSFSVSSDETFLVSGSKDGIIQNWPLSSKPNALQR